MWYVIHVQCMLYDYGGIGWISISITIVWFLRRPWKLAPSGDRICWSVIHSLQSHFSCAMLCPIGTPLPRDHFIEGYQLTWQVAWTNGWAPWIKRSPKVPLGCLVFDARRRASPQTTEMLQPCHQPPTKIIQLTTKVDIVGQYSCRNVSPFSNLTAMTFSKNCLSSGHLLYHHDYLGWFKAENPGAKAPYRQPRSHGTILAAWISHDHLTCPPDFRKLPGEPMEINEVNIIYRSWHVKTTEVVFCILSICNMSLV